MTAARPNPLDLARFLPAAHATSFDKTFDTYRAACEVCGADCDWTVKDPRGLCPCDTPDIAITDCEEAA